MLCHSKKKEKKKKTNNITQDTVLNITQEYKR